MSNTNPTVNPGWPKDVLETINRLSRVRDILKAQFVDRDQTIELLVLGTVCHEHLLLVGPPGTAKTRIITRFSELIDAKEFHYLVTRFTEPSELFGPLDLEQFQQGTYTLRTVGMLPRAEIVFLDEVFQGSSPILNALLSILNEQIFTNGATPQWVPLMSLIGASNVIPEDPWLHAFADRFVLRELIHPVPEDRIDDLIEQGWDLEKGRLQALDQAAEDKPLHRERPILKAADLRSLRRRLLEVDTSKVKAEYGKLVNELRAEGVELSDRRIVKGIKLISGAALLRKATVAGAEDFWPLRHLWGRPQEAQLLKEAIDRKLVEAGVSQRTTVRTIEEILLDLESLKEQPPALRTDAAISAYLMELNKLRRELIRYHPSAVEPRRAVEQVIQSNLEQMEEANV